MRILPITDGAVRRRQSSVRDRRRLRRATGNKPTPKVHYVQGQLADFWLLFLETSIARVLANQRASASVRRIALSLRPLMAATMFSHLSIVAATKIGHFL